LRTASAGTSPSVLITQRQAAKDASPGDPTCLAFTFYGDAWLRSLTDSRSDLKRHFLDVLAAGHYRLPDDAQRAIPEPLHSDFFYLPNVCVFCDGLVHNERAQVARGAETRRELGSRGYRVVVIGYGRGIAQRMAEHADPFCTTTGALTRRSDSTRSFRAIGAAAPNSGCPCARFSSTSPTSMNNLACGTAAPSSSFPCG
jgi:hypothetical protein